MMLIGILTKKINREGKARRFRVRAEPAPIRVTFFDYDELDGRSSRSEPDFGGFAERMSVKIDKEIAEKGADV
jgi:hypothetical protein